MGIAEFAVVAVIALFVFGPERLPTLAADLGKGIRSLKRTLRGLTDDISAELGPEVGDLDLASLHPKTFVRRMWDDADDEVAAVGAVPAGRRRELGPGEPPPWDPDTT